MKLLIASALCLGFAVAATGCAETRKLVNEAKAAQLDCVTDSECEALTGIPVSGAL